MPFSSRLRWEFRANALFKLLERKRGLGLPVLDLTESNPTHAEFSYDHQAIPAALADSRALNYQPHSAGLRSAREAVAAYYHRRGHAVDPDHIVLTSGTSEAYSFLFKLLADPGDEALTPNPSYPLFDYLAALESVRARPYPLVLHRSWGIDLDGLGEAITAATRAVVVVNPNNPTGNYLQAKERNELERIARGEDLAIICDEVFSDFVLAEPPDRTSSLDCRDALSFTLNGLSKIAGLPQMKLAWIVVTGPEELRSKAIERLELISDTYLSVGTPVQWAAATLLATGEQFQEQALSRLRQNLSFLQDQVARNPACSVLPVEGGWYAILRLPRTLSEDEWGLAFLERENVLVQPGYFYDFASGAHAVLSLLTQSGIFEEGVSRILRCVAELLAAKHE